MKGFGALMFMFIFHLLYFLESNVTYSPSGLKVILFFLFFDVYLLLILLSLTSIQVMDV